MCTVAAPAFSAMKPFIIWTLQHTGGHHLTQRLLERSSQPGIERDPFRIGNAMGADAARGSRTPDRKALAGTIGSLLDRGVNIQHCVEMVPWELTEALAAGSMEADYGHLVLYRRNPVARLLSLRAGANGGALAADHPGSTDTPSLPIETLVQLECVGANRLQKVWNMLAAQSPSLLALAIEDVFVPPHPLAARRLASLLAALRLSTDPVRDTRFVDDVRAGDDPPVPIGRGHGAAAYLLQQRLQQVPQFVPRRPPACLETISLAPEHPWIHRAAVDMHPPIFRSAEPIKLGGVVVLTKDCAPNPQLMFASDEGIQPVYWDIESRGMRDKFKESPNGSRSRFEFLCTRLDSGTRLELHHSGSAPNPLPLLALRAVKAPPHRIHVAIESMLREAPHLGGDVDLLNTLRESIDALPGDRRGPLWRRSDVALDVLAGDVPEEVGERLASLRGLTGGSGDADELDSFEQRLQTFFGRRAAADTSTITPRNTHSDVSI
jgi:hypothetical protein